MLNIYGYPLSSPVNKVRYVANYLEIPYEFHMVALSKGEHQTTQYRAINPYAKIPAIEDEGFTLAESNAIIRYVSNKYQSNLYPQELKKRAIVDQWLDYAALHIAIPFSKIMFNTYFYKWSGIEQDKRSLEDGHNFLAKNLPVVEADLAKNAYLGGDKLTLADFAMLAALDTAELSKIDLSIYPHIVAWQAKLMGQSFYKKCHESYTASFNKIVASRA